MRMLIVLAIVARAAIAGADDEARTHYERGQARYNIADFDGAIDEFKQSYELSKAPRLLFNIAQAYRLKKDWERALYFYNSYLRNDPEAPNRDDAEQRIDEMRGKLDHVAAPPDKPHPTPAPPPIAPTPPRDDDRSAGDQSPPSLVKSRGTPSPSPRRLEIAGLATAGVGVIAIAVGGGMLGLASSDAGKVTSIATTGSMWNANAQHTYDEGSHSQSAGIALLAVGGAAVVAGLAVGVIGLRKARSERGDRR